MSISFETATIADVVARAARVAPTKGAAFDKAAGIVLEFRPAEHESVTIKATDMEVSFLERMVPLDTTETTTLSWRIPATLLAGVLSGLPIGTTTKLTEKNGYLHITCGKAKAKIAMFKEIITNFEAFDPSPLVEVPGFAARVAQVSWACDKSAIPFTGVHIDGERLVATDRYRLATVPLKVPVDEPITVPLDVLTNVAKGAADARIAAVGKRLHVMPNDHAQVSAVIYEATYPNVSRAMYDDYPVSVEIDRDAVRGAIQRMMVLVKGERYPVMKLTIGDEVMHIAMDVEEVGEMEDELPAPQATHAPFTMYFTPNNFLDGIAHCEKNTVKYSYDTGNDRKNVLFDDGAGYQCWVVPRRIDS